MPSSFATTTLVLLVTTNSIGQLAAVDKKDLPSPYTNPMLVNLESCNFLRGRMEHPEKYFCQVFTSPKTTNWVYTPPGEITSAEAAPEPDHTRLERGHTDSDSLGQTSIDSPRSKLGSEAKPEPPQEAPKPEKGSPTATL